MSASLFLCPFLCDQAVMPFPLLMPYLLAALKNPDPTQRLVMTGTATANGQAAHTFVARNPSKDIWSQITVDKKQETLTVVGARANDVLADQVASIDKYAIQWALKLEDKPTAPVSLVGKSENPMYVLWKKPPANFVLYHTLVDLSTKAAATLWPGVQGQNDANIEKQIPAAVFKAFETQHVERVDGIPLRYYQDANGKWNTPQANATTKMLLTFGDGQCTAWSAFFLDALRVQGVTLPAKPTVVITSKVPREFFLVKDWTFNRKLGQAKTINGVKYEYGITIAPQDLENGLFTLKGSKADGHYLFPNAPGQNNPDVDGNIRTEKSKGQNSPTPISIFPNHILVEIDGVWYDPSYGQTYTGNTLQARANDFELKAVDGYAIHIPGGNLLYIRERGQNLALNAALK